MTGNGLQDTSLTLEQLYAQAKAAAPLLRQTGDTLITDLRSRHPGLFDDIHFELGPIKAPDTAYTGTCQPTALALTLRQPQKSRSSCHSCLLS